MSNFPGNPFVTGLLLFSLTTLLTACYDGSSSADSEADGDAPTADTLAPSVISATPTAGATGVDRNIITTATFDEDILGTTVDDASFTLSNDSNVGGTVTFDGASNVATLVPTSQLALLTTYTASLSTGITDLVGNPMSSAYSWSFTTADGTWGSAALLETDNAGDAFFPQVAFDGHGDGFAVWRQDDDFHNGSIMARRYVAGSGWETAELIEMDSGRANAPQIALDSSGNAVAVWQQNTGGTDSIWANRYVAGSGWGSAVALESTSTNAHAPEITLNANGDGFAVWFQSDGTRESIWANRYDANSGWGTAELIEFVDTGIALHPKVAVDNSGNALAVWRMHDGSSYNLWFNRHDTDSWGTAALLEKVAADTSSPELAMAGNGDAVVVWSQYDGFTNNVLARPYQPVSGWGSVTLLDTDTGFAPNSQIALDAEVEGLAVWQNNGTIWSNRYGSGSWGTAQLIQSDDAGSAFSSQIASDGNGNAAAVWVQHDGSVYNIWANRYATGSWGTAQLIKSDDAGNAFSPQIAFDGNGNAAAVWYQYDGSVYNIWANRYE